jgi:hypothetical protein
MRRTMPTSIDAESMPLMKVFEAETTALAAEEK